MEEALVGMRPRASGCARGFGSRSWARRMPGNPRCSTPWRGGTWRSSPTSRARRGTCWKCRSTSAATRCCSSIRPACGRRTPWRKRKASGGRSGRRKARTSCSGWRTATLPAAPPAASARSAGLARLDQDRSCAGPAQLPGSRDFGLSRGAGLAELDRRSSRRRPQQSLGAGSALVTRQRQRRGDRGRRCRRLRASS